MVASGTSFLMRMRHRARTENRTVLGLSIEAIEAADIFKAARSGESFACECVEEEARWLGLGIVNLIHLFNPARFVIGGGMSNNLDLLLPGIFARIDNYAMSPYRNLSIVKAGLGDNAGLIGAALLASETLKINLKTKHSTFTQKTLYRP